MKTTIIPHSMPFLYCRSCAHCVWDKNKEYLSNMVCEIPVVDYDEEIGLCHSAVLPEHVRENIGKKGKL